jgi:hypothetical protein
MMDHGILNLVWLAVLVYGLAAAFRRSTRGAARRVAERSAARRPVPAQRPPARRPQPPVPPPLIVSARPRVTVQALAPAPLDAADAFPGVDLSLPDAGGLIPTAGTRRRSRSAGRGAAFASGAWAANAIVGAEVLGPPLALRPGATFGAPRAF